MSFTREDGLILPIAATIVTSIVAIALPLSIQMVTTKTKNNFNDGEVSELIFNNSSYKSLRKGIYLIFAIIFFSVIESNIFIELILMVGVILFLWFFQQFIRFLEEHVSDFSNSLIENEKAKFEKFSND